MSDQFWKRLSLISGFFFLTAIFSLLYFGAHLEVKDLDLWLHVGVGRYIVQHGFQIPYVDILSCTISGKPWINHEWLFQVIVYRIFNSFGMDGLIKMQAILVTVTLFVLLILGYNNQKQLPCLFALLLVTLVYQSRFTIRPDLFSLLFFSLYIFVLSFFLNRRWSVYALFIVQVLWNNMHGFFFFGPLFVLIGLVGEWIKRHIPLPWDWNKVGRLTDDEYRRLKWILFFVIIACLLNPYTFKGAWYPLGVLFQISGDSKIFFDYIVELKRPILSSNIFSIDQYPYYKLLIILSFISLVFNRRKIDIGVFIFWLIFLFFSLSAIRNLVFFAFAAYLVFVTNALTISLKDILPIRFVDKKFISIATIIIHVFLTLWTLQILVDLQVDGYYDFDKYQRKSEYGGVSQRVYPIKAVDFLVENKVHGNIFNDFNSGAYLVGRCNPDIKVFMDGRTEVYGPQFFKYYEQIWGDGNTDLFAKAIDRYQLTAIFFNSVQQTIPDKLLQYTYKLKDWVPVYFNYDGIIFLKNVERNKKIIEKHRLDLAKWKTPQIDLYRLGAVNVAPYQYINRAYTLEALGLSEPAMAEAREALKINSSYAEAYKILGKIYGKQGNYQKAYESLRLGVLFSPGDLTARTNMALALYDLGQYGYAAQRYQEVIDRFPKSPKAYFMLAKSLAKNKKDKMAIDVLQQAHALAPDDTESLLLIGDIILANGDYDLAKQAYELGANAKTKKDRVHFKLGIAFKNLGDIGKAQEEFKKGLAINADNPDLLNALGNFVTKGP